MPEENLENVRIKTVENGYMAKIEELLTSAPVPTEDKPAE